MMAHLMPKASRIDRFSEEGMLKGELVVRARTVIMYAVEDPAGSELRVSDDGVTIHTTGDTRNVYARVEIPRGIDHGMIGSGMNMRMVGVGSHNLQKHGTTDLNLKLPGVHVTEGLGFIHFCVHDDGQSRETITSDQFYNCLTLPRDSHLYATRLNPTPQTLAAVPATCGGDIVPLWLAIVPHTLPPFSIEGVGV